MMPVLCVVVMPNFSSLENGIVMIVLPRQKKYIEVELARGGNNAYRKEDKRW